MSESSYLINRIEEQIEDLSHAMAVNKYDTIEDYKYAAGQIRGLVVAMNIIKDRADQLLEDDDYE